MHSTCAHELYALRKYQTRLIAKAARGAVEVYADKLQGNRGIIVLDPRATWPQIQHQRLSARLLRRRSSALR